MACKFFHIFRIFSHLQIIVSRALQLNPLITETKKCKFLFATTTTVYLLLLGGLPSGVLVIKIVNAAGWWWLSSWHVSSLFGKLLFTILSIINTP